MDIKMESEKQHYGERDGKFLLGAGVVCNYAYELKFNLSLELGKSSL